MSVAIVVLLAEVANDIHVIPALLLVVLVAYHVNKELIRHPYDEQLIIDKEVPFLEHECPHHLDHDGCTVGSLCARVPWGAVLRQYVPPRRLEELLMDESCRHLQHFPVVDDRLTRCIALVPRGRLQAAVVHALAKEEDSDSEREVEVRQITDASRITWGAPSRNSVSAASGIASLRHSHTHVSVETLRKDGVDVVEEDALAEEEAELHMEDTCFRLEMSDGSVNVFKFADPAPHSVLEDTPVARIYPLFSRAGIDALVVIANSSPGSMIGQPQDSGQAAASNLSELPLVCEKCGNMFMPDARWCRKCGALRSSSSTREMVSLGLVGILTRRQLVIGEQVHFDHAHAE